MPSIDTEVTVTYLAYNVSTSSYETGDVANHTLIYVKDGVKGVLTNSPAEIDASDAPGLYSITLTASENSGVVMAIAGKSSTANVILICGEWTNKITPSSLGPGKTQVTYTLTDAGATPIPNANVWVTTDVNGTNIVASSVTNDSGEVVFYLDSGSTYYVWKQKAGYTFENPETEVA